MEIFLAILTLIIGSAGTYFVQRLKSGNQDLEKQKELAVANSKIESLNQKAQSLENQIKEKEFQVFQAQEKAKESEVKWATLQADFNNLQKRYQEHKEEVKALQDNFKAEFKALAGDVLREQSKDFKEKNESVLQPFRDQLKNFQEVVSKQMEENTVNATSFKHHITALKEMNQKISEDAQNLTKALKGDNKQQGNWGELILEKILESSELVKGSEYDTQVSLNDEDDKRIQPDVVIYLPENKHIIIDSKVSLTAYERLVSSDTLEAQEAALKEHILSIKTHIKNLSEKKYQNAKGLSTPDFILLFIPIESSFGIAIKEDIGLFNYAWDRKIVLVSPSTLLATLKTVASIWKQEKVNKNVLAIADESAKLYDKFVGFLEDLESIESSFKKVGNQFEETKKKLSTGSGNIISRIEKIKKLGLKTNKNIGSNYLEESQNESDGE